MAIETKTKAPVMEVGIEGSDELCLEDLSFGSVAESSPEEGVVMPRSLLQEKAREFGRSLEDRLFDLIDDDDPVLHSLR